MLALLIYRQEKEFPCAPCLGETPAQAGTRLHLTLRGKEGVDRVQVEAAKRKWKGRGQKVVGLTLALAWV